MEYDNYELFKKRIKTYNTIPLEKLEQGKLNTFITALERSYNREIVERKDGTEIKCLISGINTQPKIEKKSFSTLASNDCEVGEVLYWPRRDTHWIITDMEETEKSIFQGYISQALYHLKWVDPKNGNAYDEWACTKGPEETTISDGTKNHIWYDKLNQSLFLWMPKHSKGMDLLDRYFEIFVNGRKWQIQVTDRYSYKNLITLQLKEALIDEDRDDKDKGIVDGKIPYNYSFSCSLDGIDSLRKDEQIDLLFSLFKNEEEVINFKPEIITKNCEYTDGRIIFNQLGEVSVRISYKEINKHYDYLITVSEDVVSEKEYKMNGPKAVKTMTTVSYSFECFQNGMVLPIEGIWKFDKNFFTLIEEDSSSIKLKVRNKIGMTKLSYTYRNGQDTVESSFDIKISSIYGRN